MQSVVDDYDDYVAWLRTQCEVVEEGLVKKRETMAQSPFGLMRATYFRWARTAPSFASHLADAPLALCVGDIHVENFGTWVDAEGRRVWGVNDFDEGAVMPYALDLVRLLVSALLAPSLDGLRPSEAAAAVLEGYRLGLNVRSPRFVEHGGLWFRTLLAGLQDEADKFWSDFRKYDAASPPKSVAQALKNALPRGHTDLRFLTKQKGAGSLGRPRYMAFAKWQGGAVAREAKAIVPSAWDWASGALFAPRGLAISDGSYRSPDASLLRSGDFVIRRIGSDARKLDLKDVKRSARGAQMLRAMAADLAAVHAATGRVDAIEAHIKRQAKGWLLETAKAAKSQIEVDFRVWGKAFRSGRA